MSGTETTDRARQIVEGLRDGFLGIDAGWRVTDCNAAAQRFLDRTQEDLLGREIWEISGMATDGAFADLARKVAATRAPADAEVAYPRQDGERLVQVQIFPLGLGLGAILRDITEVRIAERRLAESQAQYRELADGTPAAAWLSKADGELEFINEAMAETLGRSRESLLGEGWLAAIDPDDRATMLEARTQARASHSPFHYEGRFRRADGGLRIIRLYARPRFDTSGAFLGHVGMASDVTEARAAERQQKLLIDELNHRVKNTLATVQSLVSQTLRGAGVPHEVEDLVAGRLLALSAAHNVLNRELWSGAVLADIIGAVVRPYADAERLTVSGPAVSLEPNAALSLAMALHELAVNAVKHGALSTSSGQVRLEWTHVDNSIALEWRESGGARVAPPERSGFGTRLLGRSLKAELVFAPEGLTCRLRLPAQSYEARSSVAEPQPALPPLTRTAESRRRAYHPGSRTPPPS